MVFGKLFGKKPGNPEPQAIATAPDTTRVIDVEAYPWQGDAEEAACAFALRHLLQNLPQRLTLDGKLHAETYLAASGAIAGYAAQCTLFDRLRTKPDAKIQVAETQDGNKYFFADELNLMLVPETEADAGSRVWPLAAGAAADAGLAMDQMPDLNTMFAHVASVIGTEAEGWPSVAAQHRPHMRAREALKIVWPVALTCFSGHFPGSEEDYGKASRKWWSAIAAHATARILTEAKDAVPPSAALALVMESAIYASKLEGRSFA